MLDNGIISIFQSLFKKNEKQNIAMNVFNMDYNQSCAK